GPHTLGKTSKTVPSFVHVTPSDDVARRIRHWDPSDPQYHILYEPLDSNRTVGSRAQTESGDPGGPLPITSAVFANPVPFVRSWRSPGGVITSSWRVPKAKSAVVVSVHESAETEIERMGINWKRMRIVAPIHPRLLL